MSSRLIRRLRTRRDERGVVSTWTILMASGVFLVLLGLVYDGGNAMNQRIAAHRAAEQAARAAADEMRGVRDGTEGINQATATYDPAGVFAGIAILLLFVVAANWLAGRLERRLLRWRPQMQAQSTL